MEYLENNNKCEYDDNSELHIDLDYNDNINIVKENDQPLDLSIKKVNENMGDVSYSEQMNFSLSKYQHQLEDKTSNIKIPVVTERDISVLIDPYLKSVNKKVICKVCKVKFVNKAKAKTHVENKHVDCLMYKCPLCRVTKVTRLAYESHLRRGHGARVKDYSPLIRLRKNFMVKSIEQTSSLDCRTDLEFVTFLRHILTSGLEVNTPTSICHRAKRCAEWIDQEQSIFKINKREEFAMEWYKFKVISESLCVFLFLV